MDDLTALEVLGHEAALSAARSGDNPVVDIRDLRARLAAQARLDAAELEAWFAGGTPAAGDDNSTHHEPHHSSEGRAKHP